MLPSVFPWAVAAVGACIFVGVVACFSRRIFHTADSHDRDITEIRHTYATKDELREIRTELREDITRLSSNISEIRENCIGKDEFYRITWDINRNIEKIYSFLVRNGGGNDGEKR